MYSTGEVCSFFMKPKAKQLNQPQSTFYSYKTIQSKLNLLYQLFAIDIEKNNVPCKYGGNFD